MNAYITDQLAREYSDRLLADAVVARRVRDVRKARRAAIRTTKTAARSRPTSRARAAVTRPFVAVHAWLAAGML